MDDVTDKWVCNGVPIRHYSKVGAVCLTDLWKAADSPTSWRPDKWFKSSIIQEKLERLALTVGDKDGLVTRDSKGKISGIPGILTVVRGGRYQQGTYASYDLALEYCDLISPVVHQWFTNVLHPEKEIVSSPLPPSQESSDLGFPIQLKDFEGNVRFTPDGRISVYDGIGYSIGISNPRDAWNDLIERFPVFVGKTDKYKFPGRGGAARPTPVATLEVFLEILVTLPGRLAAQVREKAVRTLVRYMKGDPTLVDEILARITDPATLQDLETTIQIRQQTAYGGSLPIGTMSSPLTGVISSEVKSGYGWANKTPQMTDLLVCLATHVGDMVIQRESPHRAYGGLTSKSKSRTVPLILRALRDMTCLHVYQFESTYIDDADVVEICQNRAYPEIVYRDYASKGVKVVVVHLVAPGGITQAGVERLKECQQTFDLKYQGGIQLDAMRLDELVWGEMYPAIAERYQDSTGAFATYHLNRKIKPLCKKLCDGVPTLQKQLVSAGSGQLSLFSELLVEL